VIYSYTLAQRFHK